MEHDQRDESVIRDVIDAITGSGFGVVTTVTKEFVLVDGRRQYKVTIERVA